MKIFKQIPLTIILILSRFEFDRPSVIGNTISLFKF